ncbi:MAG: DUF2075 domain-containing protein [Akkermansiaceae bacterium]|nr:DUF2075 domain-containing protein [Akkermansiaceae bacterium]
MSAWYSSNTRSFLDSSTETVVGALAKAAAVGGWETPPAQEKEWNSSIDLLKESLTDTQNERLSILQDALADPRTTPFSEVILEYDFRRRGLRMDCILLAPGLIVVLEFKRRKITAADKDQAMNYAINLREFHEVTQDLIAKENIVIAPVVVSTRSEVPSEELLEFHDSPWTNVLSESLTSDARHLADLLHSLLKSRKSNSKIDRVQWIQSRFRPSSSILDAAVSLYGQHDVSSISDHALPTKLIEECVEEIREGIEEVRANRSKKIILISGAPGAGKTLVGLQLLFSTEKSVFVTGNAPLVDVLQLALKNSYREKHTASQLKVPSGYKRKQLNQVIDMTTFSIEKAHRFLKTRSGNSIASNETLVIFDEAQRTYLKGRNVADEKLKEDEAQLVLEALERDHPGEGLAVVCLLGHNQAINTGESGVFSWFKAASALHDWSFQISDTTLNLPNLFETPDILEKWKNHEKRLPFKNGHLDHSLRFYRNREIEKWAGAVIERDQKSAAQFANQLKKENSLIYITRDIKLAKQWIKKRRIGNERAGLIASSQARRLIAEGIHVLPQADSKIAHWMLAPSGDIRSSNMLEYAQNQFQVQGLELDYTILCWDADFRYSESDWQIHNISGAGWQKQGKTEEHRFRQNSYRVLLTRARKGLIIFVPNGDISRDDLTRAPEFFDSTYQFLIGCGCESLDE